MKALMTIDVEDWFHTQNFSDCIPKSKWDSQVSIVERNTELILTILAENNIKGTFFILGWVAERHPKLIKKIYNEGHEIASHGYGHDLIYELTPEQFYEDVVRSKKIIEDLTGVKVDGYRAPNFSITDWALDILEDLEFRYDSSWFPAIMHDRYGKLSFDKLQDLNSFKLGKTLNEVRLSTLRLFKIKLPWSGGAYFRFIPYPLFQLGMKRILRREQFFNFYIHPWEFDPMQPSSAGMKKLNKIRQYTNTKFVKNRFSRMVQNFQFISVREFIRQKEEGGE